MRKHLHSLKDLFDQLGLENSDKGIDEFIKKHQLNQETPIEKANFWKPHQIDLLTDSKADNADWAQAVDDLDVLLRRKT